MSVRVSDIIHADRSVVVLYGGRYGIDNIGKFRTVRVCCGHGEVGHLPKAADVFVTCCSACEIAWTGTRLAGLMRIKRHVTRQNMSGVKL